jgi:hypothetical protein
MCPERGEDDKRVKDKKIKSRGKSIKLFLVHPK